MAPVPPHARIALAEALTAALARTTEFRRRFRGVTLEQAWACDASMYSAHRFHGPGFVLVGDAGCAIDPLSSFGVKKALGSAWLAAVALHTACRGPVTRRSCAGILLAARAGDLRGRASPDPRLRAGGIRGAWRDVLGGSSCRRWHGGATRPGGLAAPTQRSRGGPSATAHRGIPGSAGTPDRLSLIPHPVVRGREIVLDDALQFPAGCAALRARRRSEGPGRRHDAPLRGAARARGLLPDGRVGSASELPGRGGAPSRRRRADHARERCAVAAAPPRRRRKRQRCRRPITLRQQQNNTSVARILLDRDIFGAFSTRARRALAALEQVRTRRSSRRHNDLRAVAPALLLRPHQSCAFRAHRDH